MVLLEGKGSVLLALEGACRKQRTVQMESLRSGEVGTCGVVGLSEFGDMSAWNRYGFRAKLEIFVRIRLGKLGAGNLAAFHSISPHACRCGPLRSRLSPGLPGPRNRCWFCAGVGHEVIHQFVLENHWD